MLPEPYSTGWKYISLTSCLLYSRLHVMPVNWRGKLRNTCESILLTKDRQMIDRQQIDDRQINSGKETNLICRSPKNVGLLQDIQHDSTLLKYELCIMTQFQRVECKKERYKKRSFIVEKSDKCFLSQVMESVSTLMSHVNSMCLLYDVTEAQNQ